MEDNRGNDTLISHGGCGNNIIEVENKFVAERVEGDIVVVDTIQDLRELPEAYLKGLVNGTYKAVDVLGYYEKADTRYDFIRYYLSETLLTDDGGSVIDVGIYKFEAVLGNDVDCRAFGVRVDSVTESHEQFQKVVDYIVRIRGGRIFVPSTSDRKGILFRDTVYINKQTQIPLEIYGINTISNSATVSVTNGSFFTTDRSITFFRTNMDENGHPYNGKEYYVANVAFVGFGFVVDNSLVDTVDAIGIESYRSRVKHHILSAINMYALVYQRHDPPVGLTNNDWDNYCDSNIFDDISIMYPKKYGVVSTHNDEGIYRFFKCTYLRPTTENLLTIRSSFGFTVSNFLFAALTSDPLPEISTNYLIYLRENAGFRIDACHIERSSFDSVFYLDRCFNGTIAGVHERFVGRNFIRTQGCRKLTYENINIRADREAGYYDIMDRTDFVSRNIFYNNIWVTNYAGGDWTSLTERPLLINRTADDFMQLNNPTSSLQRTPSTITMRDNNTDDTTKTSLVQFTHYDIQEEAILGLKSVTDGSNNNIDIGGGDATKNSATQIDFYAGSNSTNLTGTHVLRLRQDRVDIRRRMWLNGVAPLANQFPYFTTGTSMEWKQDTFPELLEVYSTETPVTATSLTDIYNYTLAGNTVPLGMFLKGEFEGEVAIGTGNEIDIVFNGQPVFTTGSFTPSTIELVKINFKILRYINGGAKIFTECYIGNTRYSGYTVIASGVNWNNPNNIRVRGKVTTGTITGREFDVVKFKK